MAIFAGAWAEATSQMAEAWAWAADGVEFPEGFVFPVTILGVVEDLHGEGAFVEDTPTRADCYVHVETKSAPSKDPPRLEILPSPLHPERGTELIDNIAYAFEQQLSLALWLYRTAPSRIAPWPNRQTITGTWSLCGDAIEGFLRFSRALVEFHDDRHAYLVARVSPDVLTDDDLRMFLVSGHQINSDWLKTRWPVMAATDLYERARRTEGRAPEADIGFLLLMMSLEVLFNDGGSELGRRISQRCAFLNGRNSSHRKEIFDVVHRLYNLRSRLVHGDLFDKGRILRIPKEDRADATNFVRLSLLRFIALSHAKTKAEVMRSLDQAIFHPAISAQLRAEVEEYWNTGPRSLRLLGPPQVNGSVGRTTGALGDVPAPSVEKWQ